MRNMDAALSDPGCSIPNIYARHCDFTWLSLLRKNLRIKNRRGAHGCSPNCFNAICFLYLREKIATCSPSLKEKYQPIS